MSSTPTVKSSLVAKQRAKVAVTVLLPTPPCKQSFCTVHTWREVLYFSREDEHNVLDCVQVPGNEVDIGVGSSRTS